LIFRRRGKDAEVKRHKPRCNFCGLSQGQEATRGKVRLIAGPGVYICSECINLANDILRGDKSPAPA
jgi:ATP-dependent Clp protease ATP-binding subunit ClpX